MVSLKSLRVLQRSKSCLPYLIGLTAVTGIVLANLGSHFVFVTVNVHTAKDDASHSVDVLIKEAERHHDTRTPVNNSMVNGNVKHNVSKTEDNITTNNSNSDVISTINTSKAEQKATLQKRTGNSNTSQAEPFPVQTLPPPSNTSQADPFPVQTLPPPSYFSKLVCNITISEEMDLMKMKKLHFIERFKNPCWMSQEKQLKCLPYMHFVGVAKCGTTDLFQRITAHPDVIAPTRKEPSWLSDGRFYRQESFAFYSTKYFSPIAKALSATKGTSNLITGDASVFDLHGGIYWPWLGKNVDQDEPVENNAEYIYHMNNQARILINLRNPIDRLWSEYLALSGRTNLSAESFHEVVKTAIHAYHVCQRTRTLRSCMYDTPLSLYASLSEDERHLTINNCRFHGLQSVKLHRGIYHVFIKDYLKVFPREQVLIQKIEDISNDTEHALVRTYQFLDLEIPPPTKMKGILSLGKQNTRRPSNLDKGDMLESTRSLLFEFYKPHNEQLSILLNDYKYNYGQRG